MAILKQMRLGDVYLVLEDDIVISPTALASIKNVITHAPNNWDIILLGYNSWRGSDFTKDFIKVRSFWGTCGYLITYKGAQKFLKETGSRFDCQIDTFMGWMAASNLLDVYALKVPIIQPNSKFITNIQAPIKLLGVESFMYRDKILQLD